MTANVAFQDIPALPSFANLVTFVSKHFLLGLAARARRCGAWADLATCQNELRRRRQEREDVAGAAVEGMAI